MPGSSSRTRKSPAVAEEDHPAPPVKGADALQPSLPLVAGAFAAGVFLGTRPGRHLTRGAVRAALLLVKPALLVGGLLKWRELARRPGPPQPPQP